MGAKTVQRYIALNNLTPDVVPLDANGGSVSTKFMCFTHDASHSGLPTPTRSGYKFNGWYTSATGGTLVTSATTVVSDNKLYAQWTAMAPRAAAKPATPTVTAEATSNGQLYVTITCATPGAKIYWTSNASVPTTKSAVYTASTMLPGSRVVMAIAEKDGAVSDTSPYTSYYVVPLDANGGSVSTPYMCFTHGAGYSSLPTPTRSGYTFNGWYTSASGGSLVTSSSTVTSDGKLYAQWTANAPVAAAKPATPTIIAEAASNGQLYVTISCATPGVKIYWTSNAKIPTTQSEVYNRPFMLPGSRNVMAIAEKDGGVSNVSPYTIYNVVPLDANGGSVSTPYMCFIQGSSYSGLPTPSRSGYTFDGWYTSASGGTRVTSSSIVASDNKLYAQWIANAPAKPATPTVKAEATSDGKLYVTISCSTSGATIYWTSNATIPTTSSTVYSGSSMLPSSRTIMAIAVKDGVVGDVSPYTIYYVVPLDANGGSVSTPYMCFVYGAGYSGLPTPTRSGYTFDGWYTAATGGSLVTASTTVTSDMRLYAHWR